MAQQYSHLFFSFYDHVECGEHDKANKVSKEQDSLLKTLRSNGYDTGKLIEQLKEQKMFRKEYDTVVIFMDGGVRNNHDANETSIAASAFAVYADQKLVKHDSSFIGDSIELPTGETIPINSTFAEYHGFLQALLFVEKHNVKAKRYIFITDCESMVKHIQHKLPHQQNFKDYALNLIQKFNAIPKAELKHVPREHNKITDGLVNQLLDLYERGEKVCN